MASTSGAEVEIDPLLPPDVLQYCARHDHLAYLREALQIARSSFAPVERLQVMLQEDPDSDETFVVIQVAMRGSIDLARDAKQTYTRQWISIAPPDVLEHIRLLYSVV